MTDRTALNIDELLADGARVQAELDRLVGSEPDRVAKLLSWPHRNIEQIGAGLELAPLEAAVVDVVNSLGGEKGIRQFFNDYGAIAMAQAVAKEFGVVLDPEMGDISKNQMAHQCGRYLTCLQAASVLAASPRELALVVDVGTELLSCVIRSLVGRDPMLNDLVYSCRLELLRRHPELGGTKASAPEAGPGKQGKGRHVKKYAARNREEETAPAWLKERDFVVPKFATIGTGEKRFYPKQFADLVSRLNKLHPDQPVRAAGARQVCEWFQVAQNRPFERYRWYLPSPPMLYRYGLELVSALDAMLANGEVERRHVITLRVQDSFSLIRGVLNLLTTRGVADSVQLQIIHGLLDGPALGRRRDWLFDMGRLREIAVATNQRYRELCAGGADADDWLARLDEGWPQDNDGYVYDPDPLGDCCGWDDDCELDSEDEGEPECLIDVDAQCPARQPYARYINKVITRHPKLAVWSCDVIDKLTRDLALRFDLLSIDGGYGSKEWPNAGTASNLFRGNLSRAIRTIPDDSQRSLVVDIAIDHLARIYDKIYEIDPFPDFWLDWRLFSKFLCAEQRRPSLQPDSIWTDRRDNGDPPLEVYFEPNYMLDRGADPERSECDPCCGADAVGAGRLAWFPSGAIRLGRKAWILTQYPDEDPAWWADIEDELVNDLLALDDNPWVVQRAARHTIRLILMTPYENWGDDVWLGFSPPELLRQSNLALKAMNARIDAVRDRGLSQFILDVAPYLARLYDIIERPGVMNKEQSERADHLFWIVLRGPIGLKLAQD